MLCRAFKEPHQKNSTHCFKNLKWWKHIRIFKEQKTPNNLYWDHFQQNQSIALTIYLVEVIRWYFSGGEQPENFMAELACQNQLVCIGIFPIWPSEYKNRNQLEYFMGKWTSMPKNFAIRPSELQKPDLGPTENFMDEPIWYVN